MNVYTKGWWQEQSFEIKGVKIKFSFLPAIHWAGGVFSVNRSLWGSWMIECAGYKIYFAGDSAYARHFTEISEKHPDIDIALMPIGPDVPREFQKDAHVNAKESVQAFIDLKAKHFIPTHWGTFKYGLDKFADPINLLRKSWQEKANELKKNMLHVLKIGQRVEIEKDVPLATQLSDYELSQD
jgi:L-ascorbate metabolism protein UlaG (beta-lactamase superfamily)